MDLFILRHAVAQERRPGLSDSRRALTPAGRKRWSRAVKGLRALGIRFDSLFHSPYLRAVQSAEIAAPLLEGESIVTQALIGSPDEALLEELVGDRVAVVGHEPWLTELVAWLVLGDSSQGDRFELKKGGVAWLQGKPQPGKMKLRALLTPSVLEQKH